jgi:hypothetical protein
MDDLVLWLAAAGVGAGLLWLGTGDSPPLLRAVLRPAVLALAGMLLLVAAAGGPARWPYALVAASALLGVWECYAGAYRLLGTPGTAVAHHPARQVQICGALLGNAVTGLTLLNLAVQFAYPQTFLAHGRPAAVLDVTYLTLLSFASAGYGDVLPGTAAGKLLAMLTVLAGLIFATILLASVFQALRAD